MADRFGGIDKTKAKASGYELLPGDAWIEQNVDILIPAAIENQITGDNVGKIGPAGTHYCGRRQRADDA